MPRGERSVYQDCIFALLSTVQLLLFGHDLRILVATPCRCCYNRSFIAASCPVVVAHIASSSP
jgi:hypothetical protein